jgi:peptidoglycan/LPS O-acetylase OafA/YrhL
MPNIFKRVTSSGRYIPEVDGLRFVAIASVVLFHFNGEMLKHNSNTYLDDKFDYNILNYLISNGDRGVPIFFAISGFILALPFSNYYINGSTKKIALKNYFLRRLTRLEPPYILVMLVLFLASIFIVKKFSVHDLSLSFISSLFYTNNFFNRTGHWPFLNVVAWTLEIEVQFYILAPLFAKVFKLKTLVRRSIVLFFIVVFPLYHYFVNLPFNSLLNFIQFFAVGLLLADLYYRPIHIKFNNYTAFGVGLVLFLFIWILKWNNISNRLVGGIGVAGFPLMILGFFYIVLFSAGWKKILSSNIISIIGGMCYSIYLLHFPIISILEKRTFQYTFTNYYILDWLIQFVIIVGTVLVVSALFFLLIEKPCMQANWPKKILLKVRKPTNFKAVNLEVPLQPVEEVQ